ncbi:telomere repeats-binding bouquet formation protein 1 isoform X1 [Varanus komodoensis]|uniref:telomere repeats-binding bouquet formation protein 1 isoform X1 n=1 Tax=Varanus komodoensis TaxID=61221 RepID=UPI001CF7D7D1|nr:telomere repeats-binding bouquet formation protein 1 isoform X1 [Varanus komodoensis]
MFEMKTDLNLLLECLKYQMDRPSSQKEALVAIYSVCQQNSFASDYFQEIGGLMFVYNLAKSSVNSMVKEGALFTLGGLAENNVFCQQMLCTCGLFEDLHIFLTDTDSSVNLKRMSVYILLVLVSNNKSGQIYVREYGCLDVLLQLFRTIPSTSKVDLLDQNDNQYHLWSSVCSALCACVNNPQNEDNQKTCSLVFPHAKVLLQSCIKPEIVRPICSFIGLTVANNSSIQHFFYSIGGLAVLDELLVKLIDNSSGNFSSTKLAVVVTKTLDACIADNSEKSLKLNEKSLKLNDGGQLEVDQWSKEIILEDYWNKAKEILYRITDLENDHHEGQVRRQILDEDISQEEILQTTSNHPQACTSKQTSNNGMTYRKMKQLLPNSMSDKLIISEFVNGFSKNKQLNPAKNLTDASDSQREHSFFHSADKTRTDHINQVHIRNKSSICGSSKSDVQTSEFLFKQPDFVIKSTIRELQDAEFLCSSIKSKEMPHTLSTSTEPKLSELRCSGCKTIGLSLNSRNISKILQSCQYLCDQHRVILESEMKYKRKLKSSNISNRNTLPDYNAYRQSKWNGYPKQHHLKVQELSDNLIHSFEDENSEIHQSDIPVTVLKKRRRIRKDFTSEEIRYLLDGVKKMGHHWNSILWAYPFQKGRTNVDLAKKYSKLQKKEQKV